MIALDIMKALGNVPADMIGVCMDDLTGADEPELPADGTALQYDLPEPVSAVQPVRISRIIPAAVAAACLLFAVGFGYLVMRGSKPAEYAEPSGTPQTTEPTALPVIAGTQISSASTAAGSDLTTARTTAAVTTASMQTAAVTQTAAAALTNADTTAAQPSAGTTETAMQTTAAETVSAAVTTVTTADSAQTALPPDSFSLLYSSFDSPQRQLYRKTLDAFPGVQFTLERYYAYEELPDRLWVTADGETKLICEGSPITAILADDLNGDGLPEICIQTFSDAYYEPNLDSTVYVYEHRTQTTYELGEKSDLSVGGFYMYNLNLGQDADGTAQWSVTRRIFYPPGSEYHGAPKERGSIELNGDQLVFIEETD